MICNIVLHISTILEATFKCYINAFVKDSDIAMKDNDVMLIATRKGCYVYVKPHHTMKILIYYLIKSAT